MVLMQFFINASGCKGRITPEISFMEHTVIIRKMTEEFDEVNFDEKKIHLKLKKNNGISIVIIGKR